MDWKEKYSFRRIIGITDSTSKSQIEKDLINHFKKNLEEKGLPIKKLYKAEWDKKNERVLVRIRVGKCKRQLIKNKQLNK